MKFLIDECLSPKLVDRAQARGYGESTHVVWLGRAGAKDWELIRLIVSQDWTLVTRNAIDFRGSPARPGDKGHYTRLDLHAGLICLNGPDSMPRSLQLDLFDQALHELAVAPDLVNQVLEITCLSARVFRVTRYALPPS